MITVPLPRWRDLFKAFLLQADDDVLSKPWRENDDNAFWFSRSAWSLFIIAQLRNFFFNEPKPNIWVPDLFCNDALSQLRNLNVNLIFYPVADNMSPNISECKLLARTKKPGIFILVHYFGLENESNEIANFCKDNSAWLIEDATHVLKPNGNIGAIGDFVIYSPHKHLPIPDGAILLIRSLGPSQFKINDYLILVDRLGKLRLQLFKQQSNFNLYFFYWITKKIIQILGMQNILILKSAKKTLDLNLNNSNNPRMSNASKNLLQGMISKLHDISSIRQSNRDLWQSFIYLLAGDSVKFANQTSPYLATFSIADTQKNEYVYSLLQKNSIPVLKWPDFPPEVVNNSEKYNVAKKIYQNYFFLPIHQTISKKEILKLAKNLLYQTYSTWQIKTLQYTEWDFFWQKCTSSNLPQSWQYGNSNALDKNFLSQCYLIFGDYNQPIAIAHVLVKSWPIIGGVVRLNRGPLLLNACSEAEEIALKSKVLGVLTRELNKKNYKFFYYAPDLIEGKFAFDALSLFGFIRLSKPPWESTKISLQMEEEDLLRSFNGKWRNQMRKGLKLGVSVRNYEKNNENLNFLINTYIKFKSDRGFRGPSEKLIRSLFVQSGADWKFNFFVAYGSDLYEESSVLGILVSIISGDTSIYFLGLANNQGRAMQANSVLLWHAILNAKMNNCLWFDVGGLGEETPKGIAEFKRGLNGLPYKLIGEWKRFCFLI